MTHRAEQVLSALEATLTGLATTGTNVERARVYPTSDYPALTINMGLDQTLGEGGSNNLAFVDRELQIVVRGHVKHYSTNIETLLNRVKSEVYAAIMVDPTLSKPFIISIYLVGDTAPETSSESDQPSATVEMQWNCIYRHSFTSTEA